MPLLADVELGGIGTPRRSTWQDPRQSLDKLTACEYIQEWNEVPGGDWVTNRAGRTSQSPNELSIRK